ncbi:TPA: N-acetyltransferase [Candidatus Geothermarchaeota archaeon]|nr:N-acetyltransferase [Candidatus Geothermarchaeota archaeon]HIQ13588.1 N-acetyltransferase [Thermoprotei archaeon]
MSVEYKVNMTSRVFYIRLPDNSKAYLKYHIEGGKLYLDSTYTPENWRGRGLAKRLVEYALDYAVREGLKIAPICSYSVYYFIKNPDKVDMLADEYRGIDLKKYYEERLEAEKSK